MSATVQLLRQRTFSRSIFMCCSRTQQSKGKSLDVIAQHAIYMPLRSSVGNVRVRCHW